MKTRYTHYNPKRRIQKPGACTQVHLQQLAAQVSYGGNPEHKMNPGDFGLTPPSDPRPAKSLCDVAAIFKRKLAHTLLQEGIRKGLVSDRTLGKWPKNVWAVTESGIALEAQLENAESGSYHGYPMPDSDPFAEQVLLRWAQSDE
jgi:hypothetical protein